MSRKRTRAAIILAAFVTATAMSAVLVGVIALSMGKPGPDVKEQAQANENNSAATTSTAPASDPPTTLEEPLPPPTTTAGARGETGKQIVRLDINPGDCVELTGAGDTTALGKTACGSANSAYKIIAKAAQCPTDADRTFHQTPDSALCLDIDWVVGGCMELTPDNPKRIDCATPGSHDGARVVEVKQNTIDVNTCSKGDRGIVYHERKFVVCVARV
ncbi:hypothetical protein ACLMAJ_34160 [Nocardia sp. KC 131]|uniref:LppU family putative lipoprotein n=1 Tax=Nocardia arseniciresistens TaxID=3392119 RepID=UPI00398E39E6